MHFVDGDGRVELVALVAGAHPLVVVPFVIEVPDDRRRARRNFVVEAVRVGLVHLVHVIARTDVVLVHRALAQPGEEGLPDARAFPRRHGVRVGIPAVEVADHRDALGIGRPHREVGARLAVEFGQVRAKLLEEPVVLAFVEQMKIVSWSASVEACSSDRQRCHSFVLLMAWMMVCNVVIGGAGNSVREKAWPAREAGEDELSIAVGRHRA